MKIENLNSQIIKPQTGQDRNQKPVSGSDFQTILRERLQETKTSTTAVTPGQEINPAQFSPEFRIKSLSTSEAAIDTLDSYKNALANRAFKNSHLESYIEDLEEKTLALQDLKENLPSDDPLEKLVDQVAALSYIETAKYRRGDYS